MMVWFANDKLSSTVESRVARSRWTKNAKPLIKTRQTALKHVKKAETGWVAVSQGIP